MTRIQGKVESFLSSVSGSLPWSSLKDKSTKYSEASYFKSHTHTHKKRNKVVLKCSNTFKIKEIK